MERKPENWAELVELVECELVADGRTKEEVDAVMKALDRATDKWWSQFHTEGA